MKQLRYNNDILYIYDDWKIEDSNRIVKIVANEYFYNYICLYCQWYDDKDCRRRMWVVGFRGPCLIWIDDLYNQWYNTKPKFKFKELNKAYQHMDQFLDRVIKLQYFI